MRCEDSSQLYCIPSERRVSVRIRYNLRIVFAGIQRTHEGGGDTASKSHLEEGRQIRYPKSKYRPVVLHVTQDDGNLGGRIGADAFERIGEDCDTIDTID